MNVNPNVKAYLKDMYGLEMARQAISTAFVDLRAEYGLEGAQ